MTNLPFDSDFIFRKALEKLEKDVIVIAPPDYTKEQQFEAAFPNLLTEAIGSEYINESIPSYSGGSGIKGDMTKQVANKTPITELSGWTAFTNSMPIDQVPGYYNQPMRKMSSEEMDILVAAVNEWFRNSGFPGFTGTKVENDGTMDGYGIFYTMSWVNIS